MVNGIRTINSHGLNKGISLRICVGSRVRHKTPDGGLRTYCEYNNEDGDNSQNILCDKNY